MTTTRCPSRRCPPSKLRRRRLRRRRSMSERGSRRSSVESRRRFSILIVSTLQGLRAELLNLHHFGAVLACTDHGATARFVTASMITLHFSPLIARVLFLRDSDKLFSTPLPMEICGCSRSKNTLLSTFLFLDQIVWLGMTGIYKNKERVELLGRISLYCWLSSSVCTTLVELGELGRLSASMKKLRKELKDTDKYKNEQYRPKLGKSNDRSLALIKAGLDLVVAVGLLQLAPKKVTPRVTGAVGFTSSLISCYQLLPSKPKAKSS